jgi:hypothetical protein
MPPQRQETQFNVLFICYLCLFTVCFIQAAAKIGSSQPALRHPIWRSTVRREFQDVGAALGLKSLRGAT